MRLYLLIKVSIIPKAARIDFTNPRPFYIQNFNPIQRRIVVDNRRRLRNYKKVKGELPAAIAAPLGNIKELQSGENSAEWGETCESCGVGRERSGGLLCFGGRAVITLKEKI